MQKLHPALQPGQRLSLAESNVAAFSYQGSWDGGCALHATAMALAMLGRLSDPLRVPGRRRRGAEAEFWKRASPHYLGGISLDELATLIWELNWGLRPAVFEGAHAEVTGFCEQEVSRGWPVIVSWREARSAHLHAVLAVGIEGRQSGRTFDPHTLLLIDPAEAEPMLAVHNARLTWAATKPGRRAAYAEYVTASYRRRVVLAGAVSIRQTAAVNARKGKPP